MNDRIAQCYRIASNMRKNIISLAEILAGSNAHWGGSLSCVEILAVLLGIVMNTKEQSYSKKDKLLFSKGHASMALYTAMAETGLLKKELLLTYQQNGSRLVELAVADPELGIECSGGSLGINLSMGVGMALLSKKKRYSYQTYVVVGDGELDEGSIWESVMLAGQLKLDNLTMIVDANRLQSDGNTTDILSWETLPERLHAFGWEVAEVDGHDCLSLFQALESHKEPRPRAIIAHTIKGKGISFMEGDYAWHDRALTREHLTLAQKEIDLI